MRFSVLLGRQLAAVAFASALVATTVMGQAYAPNATTSAPSVYQTAPQPNYPTPTNAYQLAPTVPVNRYGATAQPTANVSPNGQSPAATNPYAGRLPPRNPPATGAYGGSYPSANQIPATAPAAGPAGQFVQYQEEAAKAAAIQPGASDPKQPMAAATAGSAPALLLEPGAPNEHPLAPAIRWAKAGLAELNKIQDYSCNLVKRERIDGQLNEHEYMFVKVRHQPYSVYMYFLGPAKLKGQEALYVQGQNDGNLMAHANGLRHKLIGTVSLKPDSMLAMSGQRYPITQLGIKRLTERLIEVGEQDMRFGECEVKMLQNAKVSGRDCTCIVVIHPKPRKEFLFHMARIYIDNQLNLPIRYEAYEWPQEPGGPPVLVEEYTYLNLKLNNGFTDKDFDPRNPNYQFQ
jgi:hypothetical protein